MQARLTEVQGSSEANHRYLGGDKSLSPRREYSQQNELSLAEEYLEDYLKLPAIPGAQKGGIRGSKEMPLSSTLKADLKYLSRDCLLNTVVKHFEGDCLSSFTLTIAFAPQVRAACGIRVFVACKSATVTPGFADVASWFCAVVQQQLTSVKQGIWKGGMGGRSMDVREGGSTTSSNTSASILRTPRSTPRRLR